MSWNFGSHVMNNEQLYDVLLLGSEDSSHSALKTCLVLLVFISRRTVYREPRNDQSISQFAIRYLIPPLKSHKVFYIYRI